MVERCKREIDNQHTQHHAITSFIPAMQTSQVLRYDAQEPLARRGLSRAYTDHRIPNSLLLAPPIYVPVATTSRGTTRQRDAGKGGQTPLGALRRGAYGNYFIDVAPRQTFRLRQIAFHVPCLLPLVAYRNLHMPKASTGRRTDGRTLGLGDASRPIMPRVDSDSVR